jgi:hypothetical protein
VSPAFFLGTLTVLETTEIESSVSSSNMESSQRLFGARIYLNFKLKSTIVIRNGEPKRKLMVMIVGAL